MQNLFFKRSAFHVILILPLLLSMSCAPGKYLKTETVKEADIRGTVTLYLYEEYDLGGVAIIDIEGDDYTFEIRASQHNYSVMNQLTADQAIDEAAHFVASWNKQMRTIQDNSGTVIGYEIRPLFQILRYGESDIFDTFYRPAGNKIIVTVHLKRNVRKMYEYDLYRSD